MKVSVIWMNISIRQSSRTKCYGHFSCACLPRLCKRSTGTWLIFKQNWKRCPCKWKTGMMSDHYTKLVIGTSIIPIQYSNWWGMLSELGYGGRGGCNELRAIFCMLHVIFGWDNAMLRELGWDEKGRKGSGELLGVGNVSTERCNEAGTWEGALRGMGWRGVVYIKLSLLFIWAAFHVRMMSSKWGL